MKRAAKPKKAVKIALALTWDGARWPRGSLPAKARGFLAAGGFSAPNRRAVAKLFAENSVSELRVCWVPRLKGGDDVLADVFRAPKGRRVAFRVVRTVRIGDVLGVVYRRK